MLMCSKDLNLSSAPPEGIYQISRDAAVVVRGIDTVED